MLSTSNAAAAVSGLHFGSCLIATKKNASFFLSKAQKTRLQWMAGYTKSVDWVDSSAVDMIFWSKYLLERKRNKSRKNNKKTELQMVKDASSEMKKLMPTVFTELGFNVYYLDNGGVVDSVW